MFATDNASFLTVDAQLIGAICLCLALVLLAAFVILQHPGGAINRRFGVMVLTSAAWMTTISVALATNDPHYTTLLGRFGFAFASAIPFSLLWMVQALSDSTGRHPATLVLLGLLSTAFVAVSLFSPLIVAAATPGTPRANFVYGPAYRLFGVYFLFSFGGGLYTLRRTIQSTSGLRRLQLRYLLLSISLTAVGATTTNLLIPLIWHTSRYSAFAPYFCFLFFGFFAHAIIRYRLMDIKVVIRQGVVYVSAILISASLFLIAAEFLQRIAGYEHSNVPVPQALLAALLLAIFFQPLKVRVQRSLNRYLYRETYDYQRTVRNASRRLSTMLELRPLLNYLSDIIERTFKVERVIVYLNNPATNTLAATVSENHGAQWQPTPTQAELQATSPVVTYLKLRRATLVREEARSLPDEQLAAAARALHDLGGDIAFPLTGDQTLLGLLIVGPKRSGDPYFAEDIDLLETLVSQAAVAMNNAQLYGQVVLANEYVDNILSTMDSGVVAVNADGAISLFNPAAERLTEIHSADVLGTPYRRLPAALASPLRDALEDAAPRSQFETSLQSNHGATTPLVCSTAILTHRGSNSQGALIVFSDLTRLKDLEREKRRAERLASFGALASGVAHEIKNPLVAIRTFAELLPERFADNDFREDFAKVVVREIDRIDDLVGRLRGIAGTAPQRVETVDIREPITDTLRLLRAQLEQARIATVCDFEDQQAFVAVEETQLKQLFLNLFLNAIEAMGCGGDLIVHVHRRHLPDSNWVAASVTDTGPGIPDFIKSSIFEPFFTTKPRGSGLGLAICRAIADANHGTIRAENTAVRSGTTMRSGTTVTVEFPAAQNSRALAVDIPGLSDSVANAN
jgi:signal transduction histidine kinase